MNRERPVALMTVAQGLCVAAVPVMACLTVPLVAFFPWWMAAGGILLLLCGGYVAWQAFSLCAIVKRTSAFCLETVTRLKRIATALAAAGVLLIPLGMPVMDWLLDGLPVVAPAVRALLPSFTFLGCAAMVQALQLLMARAVTMQTENDLTV